MPTRTPIVKSWHWTVPALALAALACMVAGGAAAQEQESPPRSERAMQDNVPVEPVAQDNEIQARLQRILVASGWFTDPRVEVKEGIVFLDGFSETLEQSQWAGALAARTEDVVAVVNRIEVKPEIDWDLSPALQEVQRLSTAAQRAIPIVVIGAVILLVTWQIARLAARFMGWVLRNRIASPLMLTVVSRAFAVPVFILGLYLVLQISGLTNLALTVLGGTGLAGIIIGFAFRDIAENFLASLLLSVRNPFRAGDVVRIGGSEGIVVNLNTRSTVLLTQEGNHVQIPNATVFKSVITNFSSNPSRRGEFSVGIGYDDRTSQAQEIVERVLTAHPAVRTDPAPFVIVDELAAATVNLKAYFWFDSDIHSPLKLRSALMRQTKQALINGGISMPDEAREVIFPQGLPLYRAEPGGKPPVAPKRRKPPPSAESDATHAEGGLASEDEDILREAGAARTADERENLLKGS
ncbi:MAG: mechanosensitive ion channel [Bauldia sp.]|uniref:mechanosensitive ion channel family protein n=1 Tax=Bauldia sp. TaxID=2575872 RepID=UPI001DB3D605|nr:mechanosensitive ion channel family protein [Bauldia sp.]MCB1496982.1 mechanosensitive ion channel [Bauldia sp.]